MGKRLGRKRVNFVEFEWKIDLSVLIFYQTDRQINRLQWQSHILLRVLLLSKLKKKTIFKYLKKKYFIYNYIFFSYIVNNVLVYKKIFLGTFNYFLPLQRAFSKRCILICGTLFCLPVTNLFKITTRFNSWDETKQ